MFLIASAKSSFSGGDRTKTRTCAMFKTRVAQATMDATNTIADISIRWGIVRDRLIFSPDALDIWFSVDLLHDDELIPSLAPNKSGQPSGGQYQQGFQQKQRCRKPLHLPSLKPSPLQTNSHMRSLVHDPRNLWPCDSHILPSTCHTTSSARTSLLSPTYICKKDSSS